MATENEIKYILDDPQGDLEAYLASRAELTAYDVLQVYINKDTRIRRFTPVAGGPPEYVFSFKKKVNGEAIEIEIPMSETDFAKLWPTAESSLTKRRYKLADGDVGWDIDFFKDPACVTYFVVAEAEMPEGMERPERVPAFVTEHLLRFVGREGGFGNRKLTEPAVVAKLLRGLRAEAARTGGLPPCDPAAYQALPPVGPAAPARALAA